jgi:hypothetical protein
VTAVEAGLPATVPTFVTQAAMTEALGQHRAAYPLLKGSRTLVLWSALLGVLAAFALLATVMIMLDDTYSASSSASVLWTCWGLTGIAAVIELIVLSQSPLMSAKARERGLHAYDEGFVLVDRKGAAGYRYDAVRLVYQAVTTVRVNGIAGPTVHEYNLQFSDGRKLQLTGGSLNMAAFGPVLQEEICGRQAPKALAFLRTGKAVVFGPYSLTGVGLTAAGKSEIGWQELSGVEVRNGVVRLARDGKWFGYSDTKAENIPNLYTFLTLVEQLIQGRGLV